MKAWLRKVGLGLKIAEQVAVIAGEHGLTIQGRNPAEIDAAARTAALAVIAALKKPGPQPVPSGVLLPPGSTGE